MKKILKLICLCLVIVPLLDAISPIRYASAQTYTLSKTYEHQYLFAVPEGGWSSISVYLNYAERYTKYDDITNKFYSRDYVFAYKCAYATSKPWGEVLTIKHYTGSGGELHNFTVWNNYAVIMPSGYDFTSSKQNGKNKFYMNTTSNYAHITFQVSCSGAVPPIQAGGVKLNLKTK